jgi:cobalt/nickel transport system ATP-binding protein
MLVALLKPQRGEVLIDNRNIKEYAQKDLYQRVGLVLQNPRDQLFAPTVEDDVAFGPRNLGLSEEEVQQRVSLALESVGALKLKQRAIHHLSFGEQKRVSVAGILAMKSSTLILDEPTAGLDPSGEEQMLRMLNRLNRENGITIVTATHSVDLLPLFADRVYVLKNGRVLRNGSVKDIFDDHEIIGRAKLRLPYIGGLLDEMKRYDGIPIGDLPLTVREARRRLVDLIPEELLVGPRVGWEK